MTHEQHYKQLMKDLQEAVDSGLQYKITEAQDAIDRASGWSAISEDIKQQIRDLNEHANDVIYGHQD